MTAQSTNTSGGTSHQDILELLPWFVNGTLGNAETALVEAHMHSCADCVRALEQCRVLASAVAQEADTNTWQPSATHFANLMRQVDADSAARNPARGWLEKMQDAFAWLGATPAPARWALGIQGALVLMLGVGLWMEPVERDFYQTMSSAAPRAGADRTLLKIVFADDITEKELRGLLQGINAEIAAGPSAIGVYTVRMSKSGTPDSGQQAVLTLRAHPKVRLAEEIHP